MKKLLLFVLIVCLCTVNVFAAAQSEKVEGKFTVVATTTMLNDMVKVIGGDKVVSEGLMGIGIDPHGYQATAGDVSKMQNADIVVYNGLHLEGKMGEIFENLDKLGKEVIVAANGVDPTAIKDDPAAPGVADPHIWFDVTIWADVAEYVTKRFTEIDPDNAAYYTENYEDYAEALELLDHYALERIQSIPEGQRYLVTAHDAFNYLGRRYGLTVKAIQGISTESEAGTKDVSELAGFIAENNIKAIFVESSVPKKNVESLQEAVAAQGFDVAIGGELNSDSLGPDIDSTYLSSVKHNIDTIVNALK